MRSLETGIGVFLAIAATAAPAAAQRPAWHVHEARDIVTVSHGVRAPGGVAYDATKDRLVVLDRGSSRVLALSPFADPAGSTELASPIPAAHATIDRAGRQLVWVDESTHEAVRVGLGNHGLPEGEVARVRLPWLGPLRVAGIAVTEDGDLHVLDRLARQILSIPRARWTGTAANAAIASFKLADVGPGELRGLAYDAHLERFYTLVLPAPRLVEFDRAGEVTATEDVTAIHLRDPGGIAMAPSGDPTDDPRVQSVYVADARHAGTHGAVIEIRIHRDLETGSSSTPGGIAGMATFTATHVRTVETSRWSPPSPDPSGVHWDATRQRLLIVDGEVEEMGIYDDANFFESSLTGTLLASSHTTRFSNEPVGITRSATRVIISDDDVRRVFFVHVGGDGRVGGSDDTWTSLDTRSFGCDDPEGIAYDPATNSIFIADGLGEEVFVVRPGSDGQLGTSDDIESHWDTSRLGIHDPEALEWDPVRGTIWVMDSDGDAIVETTLSGSELNRLDISGISLRSPAGLTLGPHSANSSNRSFYIVCRGTDNDSDSRENDGTLTEVTASFLTGTGGGGGGEEPPPGGGGDFRVAGSSDDAEQRSNGSVVLSSSDLELTTDSGNVQTVGVRFTNITVPKNAVVVDAWIQFAADASHSVATSLLIQGQASDNAATFTTADNNITSRARTSAGVNWSPSAWTSGAITAAQRTPSLRTIVQELVNRSGWSSGNAMAFVISGTGTREAVAYDGDPTEAAVLHIEVEEAAPANEAPVANAGPDQEITLPAGATLAGSATDDGEPGPLTFAWSTQSGPAAATFANPNAASTSVTFPVEGVYVLRLTASDGELSDTDDVTITVNPEPDGGGGGGGGTSWRIASSSDDAEQYGSAGTVSLTSGDLELVTDGSKVQTVGMRFTNIGIAKNATITNAWIQFTADASGSAGTSLVIQGQAVDHAPTFTTAANSISTRERTTASVGWTPSAWTAGAAGAAQRTPDLAPIVQQLVNRGGWASGNAMAFIVTGSGLRSAVSFDGGAEEAAVLHIETGGSGANQAPNVDAGPDRTITLPALASLDGTVSDDAQVNPTPTTVWSRTGGTGVGTVVFTNPNAVDTDASFTAAGTYVLRLTANDGALESWDEMTVTVNAGGGTGTIERRVAATNDDAEEDASGAMDINSSDLELVYDGSNQQVGLRFLNLTIPQGATITNAWVQFTVDEKQSVATSLRVYGQAADDPIVFASANKISVRPKTTQFVSWAPPAWSESAGTAGANQRTPNLAPVIQEIVSRGGWASGNPLVLIITGTGHRTAKSYNLSPSEAPLLHVEYSTSTAGSARIPTTPR